MQFYSLALNAFCLDKTDLTEMSKPHLFVFTFQSVTINVKLLFSKAAKGLAVTAILGPDLYIAISSLIPRSCINSQGPLVLTNSIFQKSSGSSALLSSLWTVIGTRQIVRKIVTISECSVTS